jgi:hypothetical protein
MTRFSQLKTLREWADKDRELSDDIKFASVFTDVSIGLILGITKLLGVW